jgi:hypothetical protein
MRRLEQGRDDFIDYSSASVRPQSHRSLPMSQRFVNIQESLSYGLCEFSRQAHDANAAAAQRRRDRDDSVIGWDNFPKPFTHDLLRWKVLPAQWPELPARIN